MNSDDSNKYDNAPQAGGVFSGIRLVRVLGTGGFGSVWLGVDGVGTHIAIKLISKRSGNIAAAEREQMAAKLLRESATVHSNLVKMHHIGSTDDYFYYTMDLADPQDESAQPHSTKYKPTTLESLLASGVAVSPDVAAEIVLSLLAGLKHLHTMGIVHRDVKPANILMVGGSWKLADFGVATLDRTELTTVGTLGYLAPNGKPGPSSDLFAVGKILYCLVTGKRVNDFPSIGNLFEDSVERVRRSKLIRVVNRACSQDPTSRYASADEFAHDIQRAVDTARIKRARTRRMLFTVCPAVFALVWIGYKSNLPEPIKEGDHISTVTIPSEIDGKLGGQNLTFVVTHVRTWRKSIGGNGHRYLALLSVRDVSQWGINEAMVVARDLGGYLVSIETLEENAWLYNEIAQDRRLWRSFVRNAPAADRTDSSTATPKMSPEAEDFLSRYRDDIAGSSDDDFQPKPAGHGPLIGVVVSDGGESLEWMSGSQVTDGAWATFQPYFEKGDTRIAFGFGNMQSDLPMSSWYRRGGNNSELKYRWNTTISFIVEFP